jgi:hypothetical protein
VFCYAFTVTIPPFVLFASHTSTMAATFNRSVGGEARRGGSLASPAMACRHHQRSDWSFPKRPYPLRQPPSSQRADLWPCPFPKMLMLATVISIVKALEIRNQVWWPFPCDQLMTTQEVAKDQSFPTTCETLWIKWWW